MRRITVAMWIAALAAMAAVGLAPSDAAATPDPNSAVFNLRVFNDCPTSEVTTEDDYPALVAIQDAVLDCAGFANLHNWQFSENDIDPAVFNNDDSFRFGATLVITGATDSEAGLLLSPWWAQDVDGRFNCRTTDGEIACFGGRLPFYSFTAEHGINYVKGDPIYLEMTYLPNSLTEEDPATIEYLLIYDGMEYSSGPLAFDMGNPDEDPPYGLWGILNDARAGGYIQCFLDEGNPDAWVRADWNDIDYEIIPTEPTATKEATWGGVKATYK
ncbi:MAG: hypothetical protein GF355_00730, partial [Candidatus Eisenbacteria bacterium]|nr:hypothetical protein [Candidatus Eisenbacteria bacterium]